jgi:hypothetical protein
LLVIWQMKRKYRERDPQLDRVDVEVPCPCKWCLGKPVLGCSLRSKHIRKYGLPNTDDSIEDEGDDDSERKYNSEEDERKHDSTSEEEEEADVDTEPDDEDPEEPLSELDLAIAMLKMMSIEILEAIADKHVTRHGAEVMGKIFEKNLLPFMTLPAGVSIPKTYYMFQKLAGFAGNKSWLCDICPKKDHHVFFPEDADTVCPKCGRDRSSERQMIVFDIVDRLKRIWAVPKLARALKYAMTREKGDGDVWDGQLLSGLSK